MTTRDKVIRRLHQQWCNCAWVNPEVNCVLFSAAGDAFDAGAAAEREACAQIAKGEARYWGEGTKGWYAARTVLNLIRARGEGGEMSKYKAPEDMVWVCAACGKTSKHRDQGDGNGWDSSCFLHAVLCHWPGPPWTAMTNEEYDGGRPR